MKLKKEKLESALRRIHGSDSLDVYDMKRILDSVSPEFREEMFRKHGIIRYEEAEKQAERLDCGRWEEPFNSGMRIKRFLSGVEEPTEYYLLREVVEPVPEETEKTMLWCAKQMLQRRIEGNHPYDYPYSGASPGEAWDLFREIERDMETVPPFETAYRASTLIEALDRELDAEYMSSEITHRNLYIGGLFGVLEPGDPGEMLFLKESMEKFDSDDACVSYKENSTRITMEDVREYLGDARRAIEKIAGPPPEEADTGDIWDEIVSLLEKVSECGKAAEKLADRIRNEVKGE